MTRALKHSFFRGAPVTAAVLLVETDRDHPPSKTRKFCGLLEAVILRRLQQVLQNDVDVNFLHHKTGMTPLMTAAHAGRVAAVELLLKYNADPPNLRATDNASALHWLVYLVTCKVSKC